MRVLLVSDEVLLGKVIGSKDHFRYVVAVYREGEIHGTPQPPDPEIGEFVRIGEKKNRIFGLITSSYLVSEESAGLHLFPAEDMKIFTPELLNGSGHYIIVSGIGEEGKEGVKTGIPTRSPGMNDPVYRMTDEEIRNIHLSGEELNLGYVPVLLSAGDVELRASVQRALTTLSRLMPEHRQVIDLLIGEMEWGERLKS